MSAAEGGQPPKPEILGEMHREWPRISRFHLLSGPVLSENGAPQADF